MSLVLTGVSHKTAPVAARERLAFTPATCAEGLRALVDGEVVREALIVSTCNRVEVLAEVNPARRREGEERVNHFLTDSRHVSPDDYEKYLYTHTDLEAVRHLFRVAKRVRTETGVASSAVSVSFTAVELGRKIFDSLEGRTVLLIGAGEMAELAARHLAKAGATRVLISNRTPETARKLAAEFRGEVVAYDNLAAPLAEADVVICLTGAPRYIITPAMAREALALRRNSPLFLIDISVPRVAPGGLGVPPNLWGGGRGPPREEGFGAVGGVFLNMGRGVFQGGHGG